MAKAKRIKVGDTVQLSKLFLRSIAVPATDPAWRIRGTVTAELGFAVAVDWHGGEWPEHIAPFNLAKVGSLAACECVNPETGREVYIGKRR